MPVRLNREHLHDYQLKAIDFIKSQERCALFLDMGLGKTTSTLTAITDLKDEMSVDKVLVIAPLRVANSTWAQEAEKWKHLEHLKVSVCTGTEKARRSALMRDADIYVINRENVLWLVELYKAKWSFDCVIVDESSSFKNPSAKRFRALKKILPYTNYMVLLTGTPSPNSLMDLWTQMYLVDFGERLGRTITGYRQRFFDQDYMGYRYMIRDGCADKIHALLADKVISMDAEDYLEVPDRIDLTTRVTLPPAALKAYKELEKTLLTELDSGEEVEAITAAALANKMLQMSNGGAYYDEHKNWAEVHKEKLDALSDIVDDNPNENILVAYNYRFDLERLLKRFPQAEVLDKQQSTIDRWNRGEIKMLLAHPACLHPSTEVLTERRGWVRIIDVVDDERVHDGVEFVSHSGCTFSGVRPVIDLFGIKMTHDHKMLVDGHWERAKHVRDCEDTRRKARYTYKGDGAYLSKMFSLRRGAEGFGTKCQASKSSKKKTLLKVHRRNFSSHDKHQNLGDLAWDDTANNKNLRKIVRQVRGSRHWCLQQMVGFQKLLRRHGVELQRQLDVGKNRQREGLFQGELSLGVQYGTTGQQKKQPLDIVSRRENALSRILSKSGNESRGSDPKVGCGNEWRRGVGGLQKEQVSKKQEISDVYDLVDCGPRNRFVVRNADGEVFISHNSAGHGLNLQSGGSMIVWFGLNWSLELYQQFNARLHRQGQTRPVRIIHIVSNETIDDRVLGVLGDKHATQASLLSALKA